MDKRDFLLEIGTEELPAQGLLSLAENLAMHFKAGLQQAQLSHGKSQVYVTPRRLAILIEDLCEYQPDLRHERKGPALNVAYNAQGKPTSAALGFARSCNIGIEKLEKLVTEQGAWLVHRYTEPGKRVTDLLTKILQQSLQKLANYRMMRWENNSFAFIRPVHWLVILFGNEIINGELFGLKANRFSYGHRFHAPQFMAINHPKDYPMLLSQKGKVIADFALRRARIQNQIRDCGLQINGTALIPNSLLDEVTGLVEWPQALLGHFSSEFLSLPQEVLISVLQNHQKCFAIIQKSQELLPYFITISNIESTAPQTVIKGNEKVIQARLSDAVFFYQIDCKRGLNHFISGLKQVVFQKQLGTVYDKCQRLAELAAKIADLLGVDAQQVKRAGLLAKADLLTAMVNEFPELQGIMGQYYALAQGETEGVAQAIAEHYLPRNNQDVMPQTGPGLALALADRLDTLVGLFGIGQPPTGDKDPFALRRVALAIIQILLKQRLNLDLKQCLSFASENYTPHLANHAVLEQVLNFILERLPAYLQEQGIAADILAAVIASQKDRVYDLYQRALALQKFSQLPETSYLIAANKRIKNILSKECIEETQDEFDSVYLVHPAEQQLAKLIQALKQFVQQKAFTQKQQSHHLDYQQDYTDILAELAKLAAPLNDFFTNVLVLCDDNAIRTNRLALLYQLRQLFLTVADLSLLQG